MGEFVMFSLLIPIMSCCSLFFLPLYLVSYLGLWLCSTSLSTSKTTQQFPLEEYGETKVYGVAQINQSEYGQSYQNNFSEYEAAGLTF